ncbi:MAG TPA: hypothetical protein VLS85_06985 [Hanamia sp.]|nr:hypothetical protein [Hanamia sp.]
MKRAVCLIILSAINWVFFSLPVKAQAEKPDTVKVGIYITSVHDIDFKKMEYAITFWLWLKYKNKEFDFLHNLELPQAKSVSTSFATVDSSDNQIYLLMKMQCVMKDNWRIGNFPFDQQKLRLSIENSQYDSHSLVFEADTLGKHYDPRFTLSGWNIDSCHILIRTKAYETAFGDPTMVKPHSEYSAFRVILSIKRDASGLFWKMFLGMYIAFLIAYICFYIHPDGIDSRFGLSVGSLFAVIGNKYIIDSALPESTSFTLVDTLHGVTLFFIFAVITSTAYSLKLVKENKAKQAHRFDMIAAQVILLSYVLLNVYFISKAGGM